MTPDTARRLSCAALFALAASADAQLHRRGSEFQVNHSTDPLLYPAVAALPSGDFVVAWQNVDFIVIGDVLTRRFNALGEPIGGELVVDTAGYGATAFRGQPTIAGTIDERTVVAWQHANHDWLSIQGRFIDAGGLAIGGGFEVSVYTDTSQRGRPRVAGGADGAFVVVWDSFDQDGYHHGVFGRRFDSTGDAQTPELQLSERTSTSQRTPVVASLTNGDFVVVWQDEVDNYPQSAEFYPLLARRFDSSGQPLAVEFQINESTAEAYSYPAVDSRDDGGFVVVWSNVAPGDMQYRIIGRRFDSSGAAQGVTFAVSTNTVRGNRRPEIAMDASGDFLVVWQSYLVYNGDEVVMARFFEADTSAVGDEFQVSLFTGSHHYPMVSTDDEGRFVVAWQRVTPGSSAGYAATTIVAQRFATFPPIVDLDGDGDTGALTDALLLLRQRLGFTDATLTSGAVSAGCTRCDAAAIDGYVTSILASLDVDGDGTVGAFTDALIVLRFAFGFRGQALVEGAIHEDCTRCDAESITPRVVTLFA